MTDTIFALSSGAPPAAIAVIRITGPLAFAVVERFAGDRPEPRRAVLRTLRHDNQVIDSALVLTFSGPASATGEDIVEFHLHGGRAVIAAVQGALAAQPGLRPAEPGEFTRRAFLNCRIDLAESEALADLLAAETEAQRRAAIVNMEGGLSARVAAWNDALLMASARIEAAIDFADEDDVEPWPVSDRQATLRGLGDEIEVLLAEPPAERLKDGVRVVIAGPPNAGKSTLLNALVAREAAITSPIAGTTRDIIEVPVQIDGLPFVFIDTAGLRDSTDDSIEAVGIDRANAALLAADIVLWLGVPSARPDGAVQVAAKADLGKSEGIAVSALTGFGLSDLRRALIDRAYALLPRPDAIAVNLRQRACLVEAVEEIAAGVESDDLLLVAEHLRHARASLDRLTGRAGVEDMLDALFGRFCIGK